MVVFLQILAPEVKSSPPLTSCSTYELVEGEPSHMHVGRDDPGQRLRAGESDLQVSLDGHPSGVDAIALVLDVQLARHSQDTLILHDELTLKSGEPQSVGEDELSVVVHAWRGEPAQIAAGVTMAQMICRMAAVPRAEGT